MSASTELQLRNEAGSAKNGIPIRLWRAWSLFTTLLIFPTLLMTAANIFHRHPLKKRVLAAYLRRQGQLDYFIRVPESVEARRELPPTGVPFGDALDNVDWQVVEYPAAPKEWATKLATPPKQVEQTNMPGFMLRRKGMPPAEEKAKAGEKIILYFHGGGYVAGHPMWTPFPTKIARDTHVRVLSANYRKCTSPETAYPAPLLDALAAWAYVTGTLEFAPADIALMGDSAGSHLCLALSQQLKALGMEQPGGMALMSPWVDFTQSFQSWQDNSHLDFLTLNRLHIAIAAVVRYYPPEALRHPLFSPALATEGHWSYLANCKMFISYGQDEALKDEDMALISGLRRDGVEVNVYEEPNGVHDGPIFPLGSDSFDRFRDGVQNVLRDMALKN